MFTLNCTDTKVQINITPVDAETGQNISLAGTTSPKYMIRDPYGNTVTVIPTVDATNTFFQYLTTATDFTKEGIYEVQGIWTDASGANRSTGIMQIKAVARLG